MVYRTPNVAPASRIPEARRGPVVGRFCLVCGSVYARLTPRHTGKPLFGKDHIAAPCSEEGRVFSEGASWWEEAVEVLPPPPAEAEG